VYVLDVMEAKQTRAVRCRKCGMVHKQTTHGAWGASLPAIQACPRCRKDGGERTWHDSAQDPTA